MCWWLTFSWIYIQHAAWNIVFGSLAPSPWATSSSTAPPQRVLTLLMLSVKLQQRAFHLHEHFLSKSQSKANASASQLQILSQEPVLSQCWKKAHTSRKKKNKIRQAVQLHTVYFRLEPQCNMTPAWSENSRIQFSQGVFCPDRSTSPIWNKVKPGFLLRCLLENTEMPASFMPHNMPTYSLFLFFLFLCFFNLHSIKS